MTLAADAAKAYRVITLLQDAPVSEHAVNLFSTPIAICDGKVLVVTVENDRTAKYGLATVIHAGELQREGIWRWRREIVDRKTIPDDYHTQPSVGVDEQGGVHVAYNMHVMPWQYKRSRRSCDIETLAFEGQSLSEREMDDVVLHNRSPFPTNGEAAIPGNQITYPAFFNDRTGALFVTYRFAAQPARPWLEREFAGAVARYDVQSRTWSSIAGSITDGSLAAEGSGASPLIWEPGWTVYCPRLWFDRRNNLHVTWTWRKGEAGVDVVAPSYAQLDLNTRQLARAGGETIASPVRRDRGDLLDASPGRKFYALTSITTDAHDNPLAVIQPIDGDREIVSYEGKRNRWVRLGSAPYGATAVVCEDGGDCWAYASGPKVMLRRRGERTWQVIHEGQGYCDPKPWGLPSGERRLLHVMRCDRRTISVLEIVATEEVGTAALLESG